jgi:MSHA biogenesis protein MshJ
VNERWRRLEAKLLELSVRERALILCAGLAVVFALWDTTIGTPLQRAAAERDAERQSLLERLDALEREAQPLRERLAQDPHHPERVRLRELERSVQAVEAELRARTSGLVTPQEMTAALRDLLEATPGVEIVEVLALEPEPLGEGPPGSAPAAFRHGMDLRFDADFRAAVEFLERAERLPWRFFWSALDYEVTEHPRARIHLRVNTLGSREGWIGA